MPTPDELSFQVYRVATQPDDGDGLCWFRVRFSDAEGRLYMTSGEALHLKDLDTEWVSRALVNLATQRGWHWLRQATCSNPGLQLHWTDAHDTEVRTNFDTGAGA